MEIVAIHDIPKKEDILDVPLDNPVELYKVGTGLESLCNENDGIGIAAVQAGIPWRLFLVKGDGSCDLVKKDAFAWFADCEYFSDDGEQILSLEGCLSLRSPDGRLRSFQVKRFAKITLKGFLLRFDNSDLVVEQINHTLLYTQQGVVFQHEIDHFWSQEKLICNIGKELFLW